MKIRGGFSKTVLAITTIVSLTMTGISHSAFAKDHPSSGFYNTNWYKDKWGEDRMVSKNNGKNLNQYSYDFSNNDKNKLSSFEVCNNFGQDAWFRVWLYDNQGYSGKEQIYTFWVPQNACRIVNVQSNLNDKAGSYRFIGRLDQPSRFANVQVTTN